MSKKLVYRYVRVSTFDQTTDKYHKDDDKERGIIGVEEHISGYKVAFFDREQGKYLKSQIEKGLVEKIICYSPDRIARKLEDLTSVVNYLNDMGVNLQIESLGIETLSKKVVNGEITYIPSRMAKFIIDLSGAFSELNYWERREKQRLGIDNAMSRGVYDNQQRKRSKDKIEDWIRKPKIEKAIKFLRENPSMKNCDVAKLCDLHYHSVRKVRKMVGIEKMDKIQGEEYIMGLKQQPLVSDMEYLDMISE